MKDATEMVWVTKYALTRGVERVKVEVNGEYAYSATRYRVQYPPGHWHRSADAAIKRAESMRAAKIASVRKQLAKLEAMRFRP